MGATLTVALAGNPNSGKTTIFNNITGARQHVGNYAGVTVERREGFRRYDGKDMLLVDLPGTYSLTAHSLDELVARKVIIDEKPDIIVNILDTANLERNLYLAVQILELERPVVLALNMADVAEKAGLRIDDALLGRRLGIPVVRTVGNRNEGTETLLRTVTEAYAREGSQPFAVDYGPEIEARIKLLSTSLATLAGQRYPVRWLAIKLLENDKDIAGTVAAMAGGAPLMAAANEARAELKAFFGDDLELVIAERRYRFVGDLVQEVVIARRDDSRSLSDRIDGILTNRVLGLPIFFGIMWLLFNFVFTVGKIPQDWLQAGVQWLGAAAGQQMAEGELRSLLVDGIFGGVGTVIVFLPSILLLFLGIALLEDTGYMARAAFVMDRVMRAVGLHGKSFIPLLLGFGCNVPAIMGTRTLENPRDRMVTILVAPLMSCSARLPVYTLLTAAFFSEQLAGTVMFAIYFIGILMAVLMALVFRKLLFPGASEAFVMEMPPYHLPTLRSIMTHMWERSVLYLKKAGTLILAASILVWFATNYPSAVEYSKDYDNAKAQVEETFIAQAGAEVLQPLGIGELAENEALKNVIAEIAAIRAEEKEAAAGGQSGLDELEKAQPLLYPLAMKYYELDQQRQDAIDMLDKEKAGEKLANSYAGRFGQAIEPVVRPLGFDWKIAVGLISAVAAKEVLVSTLGTIYSVGGSEDDDPTALQAALAADPVFSPLVAFSLMVFTLLYSPCLAALAVLRRETNSWKWTAFSFVYSTVLAWVMAFIVYQGGSLLGY
jgi:ferrous iron transport protein B